MVHAASVTVQSTTATEAMTVIPVIELRDDKMCLDTTYAHGQPRESREGVTRSFQQNCQLVVRLAI